MGCGPSTSKPAVGQQPEKYDSNTEDPPKDPESPPVKGVDGVHHDPVEPVVELTEKVEEIKQEGELAAPAISRRKSFHTGELTNAMSRLEELANKREEEEAARERRRSVAVAQNADEALIEELFELNELQSKPAAKKKKVEAELNIVEGDLEEQIVKEYLEKKYFVWSDFSINLEDQILHPGADAPTDGVHTNDVEAYKFVFGDFGVGVTEEQMKQVNAKATEGGILNYSMYNLLGHSTRVKCICLSPNERFYVSSSAKDATIVMYDLRSGREFLYFDGHEDTIIGAHFSNDGKHLATASRDNTLILWDTVIGKQIFVFEHERIVICCCFSRDGKYIVSGCQDKICRVWSTKKGKELLAFKEHEGIITAVSYAPDGEYIVSASSDKTLKIWKAQTGISAATISEHTGIVMACTYSQDGHYIVSNDEKVINVWDCKKGKVSLSLPVESVPSQGNFDTSKKRTWTICSCCPGTFSYYIIAACSDRNVYILHPQTGKVVLSFFCKAAVYCLSSGLHNTIALGDAFGNVYVISLR